MVGPHSHLPLPLFLPERESGSEGARGEHDDYAVAFNLNFHGADDSSANFFEEFLFVYFVVVASIGKGKCGMRRNTRSKCISIHKSKEVLKITCHLA